MCGGVEPRSGTWLINTRPTGRLTPYDPLDLRFLPAIKHPLRICCTRAGTGHLGGPGAGRREGAVEGVAGPRAGLRDQVPVESDVDLLSRRILIDLSPGFFSPACHFLQQQAAGRTPCRASKSSLARITQVTQRLLAMAAAIWHSWAIGAPVKRSLTA
jgi:hypothetical protein